MTKDNNNNDDEHPNTIPTGTIAPIFIILVICLGIIITSMALYTNFIDPKHNITYVTPTNLVVETAIPY